jgi:hypothetical protein
MSLKFKQTFNVQFRFCYNLIYHLKILRAPWYLAVEASDPTLIPFWQFLHSRDTVLFQLVHDNKVSLEKQAGTIS